MEGDTMGHDDDTVVAVQKIAKSEPIGMQADMDNSLMMTDSAERKSEWRGGGYTGSRLRSQSTSTNGTPRKYSDECRDTSATCTEGSLLNALRDVGENFDSSGDLDEVISKMIRTRDDLIQQKLEADERVKQLGLENENLKNLVTIGKRVTQAQREEITKSKIQWLKDRKKIKELEHELQDLKTRTKNVTRELERSDFLDGFACHVGSGVVETTLQAAPTPEPPTDSFFSW